MTATVQVGTILIEDRALIAQTLGLQSEPNSAHWCVVNALDGMALDRKIHAAGWNFFFMAAEAKVMFFGAIGAKNIQNAIKRMLEKPKPMNFIIASRSLEPLPNDFWACSTPSPELEHALRLPRSFRNPNQSLGCLPAT